MQPDLDPVAPLTSALRLLPDEFAQRLAHQEHRNEVIAPT